MKFLDEIINNEIKTFSKYRTKRYIVGTMCLFVPRELLSAMGVEEILISSLSGIKDEKEERISKIEQLTFSDSICNHSKMSFVHNVPNGYPKPDMFVFATTCDPFSKMFEHVACNFKVQYLNLPRIRTSNDSADFWYGEILRLKGILEQYTGKKLSYSKLREAINLENQIRQLLRRIMEKRKLKPSPITAAEARKLHVIYQSLERKECIEVFNKVLEEIDRRMREKNYPYEENAPRLLLVSTTTRDFELKSNINSKTTFQIIKEAGGSVVVEDACPIQAFQYDIDENVDDDNLLRNLSDYYLRKIYCPCFINSAERVEHLKKLVNEYHVDGVVFRNLKFCRHFIGQAESFRKSLEESKIPTLIYETTGIVDSGTGRVQTQIESFVEMLKFKKGRR